MSKRGKNKKSEAKVSTQASEVVVEGMAEARQDDAKVLNLKAERRARKLAKKDEDLYTKYEHVVRGSARVVPVGEIVDGLRSKGRMCLIQCTEADCSAQRLVNVQDAFQVKKCKTHGSSKGLTEIERLQRSIAKQQAKLDAIGSESAAS